MELQHSPLENQHNQLLLQAPQLLHNLQLHPHLHYYQNVWIVIYFVAIGHELANASLNQSLCEYFVKSLVLCVVELLNNANNKAKYHKKVINLNVTSNIVFNLSAI